MYRLKIAMVNAISEYCSTKRIMLSKLARMTAIREMTLTTELKILANLFTYDLLNFVNWEPSPFVRLKTDSSILL